MIRSDIGLSAGTLNLFGFPEKWVNLVMTCMSSVCTSILWNGEKIECFHPKQGIRQGNPLSPYLFVLSMERLGQFMNDEVQNERWKPFRVGQSSIRLFHLFFADDIFLFCEASGDQAKHVRRCLDRFSMVSGLNVNLTKSKVFFSSNTRRGRRREIGDIIRMGSTNDRGKYL
ncbi:Ribonuclease H, partial [Quillaja saponaria]